jgi:hypothetical protein
LRLNPSSPSVKKLFLLFAGLVVVTLLVVSLNRPDREPAQAKPSKARGDSVAAPGDGVQRLGGALDESR